MSDPDSYEPKTVFLDTQVFDNLGHNYEHSHFKALEKLSIRGVATVVLTSVVVGEVKAHIRERLEKAHQQVSRAIKDNYILKSVATHPLSRFLEEGLLASMQEEVIKKFERFCNTVKAEIVTLDQIPADNVFRDYFDYKQPFGRERKRGEFPDAFSAAALTLWANKNKREIHVVSGDDDWAELTAGSKCFTHIRGLGEFLEKCQDANLAACIKERLLDRHITEKLEELVADKFQRLEFVLEGTEGEVDEVDDVQVSFGEMYFINAGAEWAEVEMDCDVSFVAGIRYRPSYRRLYTEEDDYHYYDKERGRVRQTVNKTVSVEVSFEGQEPEEIEITGVTITSSNTVHVKFDRYSY